MRKEFVYGDVKVAVQRFEGTDDYGVDKFVRGMRGWESVWENVAGFSLPRAALVAWMGEDAVKRLEVDAHEA